MNRPAAALLLATLSAFVFSTTAARAQTPSLYDSRTVVATPDAGVLQFLGPKSSGIRYDSRMIRAAQIAKARACPHMTLRCWHFVKDALVAAHVIDSRPTSPWAKEAGDELVSRYGFRKLAYVHYPTQAPVGAVLVYGGPDAGHVEIRTETGFVSDFISPTPYPRPFLGAYIKPA